MDVEDLLRAGPIAVSPTVACAVWLEGLPLSLSARQVRLLAELIRARGALVSREALYESVTGRSMPERSRSVDMDIWRLRRALGPHGRELRSARKVGYLLDVRALARAETGA